MARFLLGPRPGWQEAIVLFAIYQAYTLIRGHLPEPEGVAFANASRLIDVERALGIFHEETLQEWVLPVRPLIRFWDAYYATIHFVVPVVVLVLLWRRNRDRYRLWRNAFGVMLGVGLVGFILLPLAPPRLLPPSYGFVDTQATEGGVGPVGRRYQEDTNRFAAMPSLHMGWSTWCAFALVPLLRRRWTRALIIAYPVLTLVAIVVTANHFFLDAVGGWVALAVAVGVARLFERRPKGVLTPAPS
ncbi:MAG: phosphatase PAP2 family protein [Actinomycetota bacterium]|nr:phosphatase PAP2 family protein [Actinomycetota bacterium]